MKDYLIFEVPIFNFDPNQMPEFQNDNIIKSEAHDLEIF
jgi:hypothetical protein